MNQSENAHRQRGTGCLYLRGKIWHAKWYADGKAYTQSTKQTDEKKAEKFLRAQLAKVETGTFSGTRIERVRVSELADDFLRDYKINALKSLDDAEARWRLHLKPAFGHLRASQVSTDAINRYVDDRQDAGAANATINRELAALKRMFTLGAQATPPKVSRSPHFNMLKENNVRKGFVTDEQYGALVKACNEVGVWLRGLFEVGYTYGWRVGELLPLQVRQVDFSAGTVRLDAGTTKNDEGRVAKMTTTVRGLLSALATGKNPEDRMFTRHDGAAIADFRDAWERVTMAAQVPELLFHDLRRTAVRNMVRAGIPERVAMALSGHKTRAIFERYNIVAERDLNDAAARMESRLVTSQSQTETEHATRDLQGEPKLLN